jgi:hypothetical protein
MLFFVLLSRTRSFPMRFFFGCLRPAIVIVVTTLPLASRAAELVPVSPAMAERLLGSGAAVASELRQLFERAGTAGSENLASLADTGSPDWRLYYRDRQMLFAVPTKRNLTAAEKQQGEAQAQTLAVVLLQQRFNQLLKLDPNVGLQPESVRVVFIEPAAHQPGGGGWGGGGSGFGRCGMAGMHGGFAGAPLPFAPAGFWPSTGPGYQGACGCR